MNYTTYHKLQKPLGTEKYNIEVQNANADIIDSALNRLGQKEAEWEEKLTTQETKFATKKEVENGLENSLETLNTEIARAAGKESEILDLLGAEVERAENAEAEISQNLNQLSTETDAKINAKFAALPAATAETDGLLAKEDKIRFDDAAEKKHNHENLEVLDGITSEQITAWDNMAASGGNAEVAESAKKDGNGNIIADTYALKSIYGESGIAKGLAFNTALGNLSIGFGEQIKCTGSNSIAIGSGVNVSSSCSAGFGNYNTISGHRSFATGQAHQISSWDSAALGASCTVTGRNSIAIGYKANAAANTSCSIGNWTNSTGSYSFSEGSNTTASGECSHSEGYWTTALDYQHAQGHYNNTQLALKGSLSGTGNGTAFVIGNGETTASPSNAIRIDYNGKLWCKSAYSATGADYAEYFEWLDGNPDNENRIGCFVTLDGDKIKLAKQNDYILGIVSANPCVLGNTDTEWNGQYLKDDFGAYIIEPKTIIENVPTDRQDENGKTIYVEEAKEILFYKENPDYDPSQIYIQRDNRKEWNAVGMLGVLAVYDDGTCQVNGYCSCNDAGIATSSNSGYRVIARVKENIIKVVLK